MRARWASARERVGQGVNISYIPYSCRLLRERRRAPARGLRGSRELLEFHCLVRFELRGCRSEPSAGRIDCKTSIAPHCADQEHLIHKEPIHAAAQSTAIESARISIQRCCRPSDRHCSIHSLCNLPGMPHHRTVLGIATLSADISIERCCERSTVFVRRRCLPHPGVISFFFKKPVQWLDC